MRLILMFILSICVALGQMVTAFAETIVTPAWRLDAVGGALDLPRNFRVDAAHHISGSGQPTMVGLARLYSRLREETNGVIVLVDLRQESHGYVTGNAGQDAMSVAVSWHTGMNAGNRDKAVPDIETDEKARLQAAQLSVLRAVPMGHLDKKAGWPPAELFVQEGLTEREMAEQSGFMYARIGAQDMVWPAPEAIDAFVTLVRSLPQDAWLHLHCQAGEGRTTTFLAMAEILRSPDETLAEVVAHQKALGGIDLFARPDRRAGIQLFYDYVESQRPQAFPLAYSTWIHLHDVQK